MAFCANCGAPLGEGQQFCPNCGQPAGQVAPPQAAPPQAAPPGYGAPYGPGGPYGPGQTYGQGTYSYQQPKKGKGLWIALAALLVAIVVACILVFVVFYDDIFKDGAASGPDDTVAGQITGDEPTPNAVMASMASAVGTSESQTGSFELKMQFDVDTSQLSSEEAAMISEPWTIAGTVAYETATQNGDITISMDMMGQSSELGIKLIGDKAWIRAGDQWYEAPPDSQQSLADSGITSTMTDAMTMLSDLAIDPITWLKDQDPVREEEIDGVKVYHLSGSNPDWTKMVTDLLAMTQSQAFQDLMASGGETASSLEEQMPSPEELEQMQTLLASLFKELTIDLWVEKDTSVLRKATLVAKAAPPSEPTAGLEGCDTSSGINGIDLEVTLELDPNKPVSVEAPASALSYTDFETAIAENPELLGPLGGMLGGSF